MSAYSSQSVGSLERPFESETARNLITVSQWADEYGLMGELLPFENRAYDPIEVLDTIQAIIDDRPPTSATFRFPTVDRPLPAGPDGVPGFGSLVEIAGAWRYKGTDDGVGARWVNPEYIHLTDLEPSVTDADERHAILERMAGYGVAAIGEIAPRFGIAEESLRRWLTRHGVAWSEMRLEGIKRLSRTCHTISKWGKWSEVKLADALGVTPGSLKGWIHNHARDTAFEVPPDPSGQPWFTTFGSEQGDRA